MLTLPTISIILSSLALLFGLVAVFLGIYAAITVKAMEKSTHSVQFMPVDPEIDKVNKEYSEWATSNETLEQQEKMFAKELEEQMPEFSPTETDKKRYVF